MDTNGGGDTKRNDLIANGVQENEFDWFLLLTSYIPSFIIDIFDKLYKNTFAAFGFRPSDIVAVLLLLIISFVSFEIASYYNKIRKRDETRKSNVLKRASVKAASVISGHPMKKKSVKLYRVPSLDSVSSSSSSSFHTNGNKRKIKKRERIYNLAKSILRKQSIEKFPHLKEREFPPLAAQEEWVDEDDQSLPSEVLYILKTCRIFGHFDEPVFLELCKYVETVPLDRGDYLFRVGDPDDSIYVVSKGSLNVLIKEEDGPPIEMCSVNVGESVESLLSILDVVSGYDSKFKSIEAQASEDSLVIKLSLIKAKPIFDKYPDALRQLMRTNIIRLQRVTLMVLYKYFGITKHLFNAPETTSLGLRLVKSQSPKPTDDVSIDSTPTLNKDVPLISPEIVDNTPDTAGADDEIEFIENVEGNRKHVSFDPTLDAIDQMTSNDTTSPLSKIIKQIDDLLGVNDPSFWKNHLDVVKYDSHQTVIEHNTSSSLVYVVSGQLELFLPDPHMYRDSSRPTDHRLYSVGAGSIVGHLSMLTRDKSLMTVKTGTEPTTVALLSGSAFEKLLEKHPDIIFPLAHEIVMCCSPVVRRYDFGIKWMQVNSGHSIYQQGSACEALYIVLNGRLRSVMERATGAEFLDEYGRGESLGELELLTDSARVSSVHAVRDTELAKVPRRVFDSIRLRYPEINHDFSKRLSMRFMENLQTRPMNTHNNSKNIHKNLSTIAVVAISDNVPLGHFCSRLTAALSAIGPVLHLTQDLVRKKFGTGIFSFSAEYRLISWLGQQEEATRIVLYETDKQMTNWTKRCLRQADCIIFVGLGASEPKLGRLEKDLEKNRAQKELVLLHSYESRPRGTVEWLNLRSWCTAHHHVRTSPEMLQGTAKYSTEPPRVKSDFSRLARRLTNTSVGLVLGGGGARGLSHIGVIRAMEEQGIPIDMVGGCSIGALIGALYADEVHVDEVSKRARVWSMEMASHWRKAFDLTYPTTSMFSGAGFNDGLSRLFGDVQIEDLWIPYYCVTTDLTDSKMKVHKDGNGWRYIRASMTLTGYLPPLCDPTDGHLLVDGGYTNILPADIMKELGAQTIIAVDVSAENETRLTNYGDDLSGWWLLLKKWNPFGSPVYIPSMSELQNRLAYVSCVSHLDTILTAGYCQYLQPPVQKFSTLQFGSFDEIQEVGYNYGKAIVAAWKGRDDMANIFRVNAKSETSKQGESEAFLKRRDSKIQSSLNQLLRSQSYDANFQNLGKF